MLLPKDSHMWELLRRNRRFRLLFLGSSLSTFGDTAMYLTLPIWVKSLLHSNSAAGAVFFVLGLASLADPLSGVLVDRLSRHRVLIVVNVLTGLVVSALFLVHGAGQAWLLFAVTLLYGGSMNMIGGAKSALLTDLVDDEALGHANAGMQTTTTSLRLLAPLTGAGLFTLVGAHAVVLLDVLTFVAAVLCLAFIRVDETPPEPRTGSFRQEVTAGFGYVRRSPVLSRMIGAAALAFLVLGLYESLPFALIDGLHGKPSLFGVLTCVQGVGAVAGGFAVARTMARLGEPRALAAGFGLMALATALLLARSLPVVLVGFVVMGLSLPLIGVTYSTAIQRYTPGRLLGRVFSAGELLVGGSQTASVAVGALLIAHVDYRFFLVAIIVVLLPVGSALAARPPHGEPPSEEAELAEPTGEATAAAHP
ncbi:MFS transporter [Kitasatospora sp. NPDC052896]|uniref:MFS transporter n=1 Tax=Kitasatospora sp. NPDC052896 TaxID=3364061 RepID=UPI0037C90B00